ncbi:MAG: helix-turn-helix transcriptional regulator [Betaproteobacteria bacterium]|nr:helix-turn-helix transcriptional regulator [Betaproteobacteria bacterium]
MINVDLRAVWRVRSGKLERELDQMLIALLAALGQSGKLTVAARAAGISYRHAYNLIEQWGTFFGAPLVTMRRGKGTQLTTLGERLLWAGCRVQSRLAPELDGLASDFARALNEALHRRQVNLIVHASHDFAVGILRDLLATARIPMDLQSRGSFDALASLLRGDCAVAGFHVADGPLGALMSRRYSEGLEGRDVRLLPLARRMQGLIVARGNPMDLTTVADLTRPGVRIVNRQRGSGTRALFEFLLTDAGVDRTMLQGYDNEEITHSAVAALVAGHQADAGFGLEAAAARFGLGFLPVATERYFLAVIGERAATPGVKALLAKAVTPGFRAAIAALPGYRTLPEMNLVTVAEAIGMAQPLTAGP